MDLAEQAMRMNAGVDAGMDPDQPVQVYGPGISRMSITSARVSSMSTTQHTMQSMALEAAMFEANNTPSGWENDGSVHHHLFWMTRLWPKDMLEQVARQESAEPQYTWERAQKHKATGATVTRKMRNGQLQDSMPRVVIDTASEFWVLVSRQFLGGMPPEVEKMTGRPTGRT